MPPLSLCDRTESLIKTASAVIVFVYECVCVPVSLALTNTLTLEPVLTVNARLLIIHDIHILMSPYFH